MIVSDAVDPELRVGDLVLNEESYEVTRAGRADRVDRDRVRAAALPDAQPAPRAEQAQILDRVWSYDFGGRSSIVEIYISYLRKKIDADAAPMIHTVRGVGYLIKPAA